MGAEIGMYQSDGKRVIVFGGLLAGKMAAWDGTPEWAAAFNLARELNVEIQPMFGYTGLLAQ